MTIGYHYEESGLDHVYLMNGFKQIETKYGPAVAIDDVNGLHEALVRTIIERQSPIRGQELRFIRKHMDLSQKALACLMGESEQCVFRWEKARSKPIPGAADRLVRVISGDYIETSKVRQLLERLADFGKSEAGELILAEENGRWNLARAA